MNLHRLFPPTVCACVSMSVLSPAIAAVDLALRLDTGWGHNSNLFRIDSSATNTASGATPPRIATQQQVTGAALQVGIPIASPDTRLVLATELTAQRFGAAADLNHTSQSHSVRLPWRRGDLWEGEIAGGTSETPYPVDDFYNRLDPVDRRWFSAVVRLKATPYLELPLQVTSATTQHTDQANHGPLDEEVKSATVSALYRSALGNTAQLGWTQRQIVFPRRTGPLGETPQREHEQDAFVEVLWLPSPQTQVGLRWATRLKSAPDGQFASSRQNLFRVAVGHTLSPYTRLEAQAWRQPYQNTDAQANYGISKGYGVGLVWTPSHRVSVRAGWQQDDQKDLALFGGTPGFALNPTTQRTSLRTEYLLDRGFTAVVSATHERRVRRDRDTANQTVWYIGMEYRYENMTGAAQRSQAATFPTP